MLNQQRVDSTSSVDVWKRKLGFSRIMRHRMLEGVILTRAGDATIAYSNPHLDKMFGYEPGELRDKPVVQLLRETNAASCETATKEVREQLHRFGEAVLLVPCLKKNGSSFWCRFCVTEIEDPELGQLWVTVCSDVTQRKRTEKKLWRSEVKKIREVERCRISREIHDEFGQSLTILKMELFDLKNQISSQSNAVESKLKALNSSIDRLIKQTRQIANELRPTELSELGFEQSVERLVNDFTTRTKKKINLELSLDRQTSPAHEVSVALFRILQEALTNSVRHSCSERVDVRLRGTRAGFDLHVRDYDDFRPISYKTEEGHLGIRGMKERAEILGGHIRLENRGGTILSAYIPAHASRVNSSVACPVKTIS